MSSYQTGSYDPSNLERSQIRGPYWSRLREFWVCLLCQNGRLSEGEAVAHQDSALHRQNLSTHLATSRHERDDRRSPSFELPSSPLHHVYQSSPPPDNHNVPSDVPSTPEALSGHLLPSSPAEPSSTSLPASRSVSQIPEYLQNDYVHDHYSIPGPVLPGDEATQIYDDFQDDDQLLCPSEIPANEPGDYLDDEETFSYGYHSPSPPSFHAANTPVNVASASAPVSMNVESDGRIDAMGDRDWRPWPNQTTSLLDVIGGFPRAVFARPEREALRWLLNEINVPGVSMSEPRADSKLRASLLSRFGSDTQIHTGLLGHRFAVNSLARILAHDMNNPLVRPFLSFFPQEAGKFMDCSRQARRWHEADPMLACPMARRRQGRLIQDFYVYEPALARLSARANPVLVIPFCWYNKRGDPDSALFTKARQLVFDEQSDRYVIQARVIHMSLDDFILSYPELLDRSDIYSNLVPIPLNVIHSFIDDESTSTCSPWPHPLPNPLRTQAKGLECKSVPIWGYCDDTSGNMSKKWNKLNSWLTNFVGLPPSLVQLPYNIHFLSTSGIAPPLEMLEKTLQAVRNAREEGVIVHDYLASEDVMLIPWLFGLEGDNPMQSEMCSHIGMRGTMFCRVCGARGKDKAGRGTEFESLVERRAEFMKEGEIRSASDTVEEALSQLNLNLGARWTEATRAQTRTGIKDRHLLYFMDKLKAAAESAKEEGLSPAETLERLREVRESWDLTDDELYNPAFAFPDFDPHTCTPVEVLHVYLLGIVKYMWRDAVSRLNSEKRALLSTRLSSLDVHGLGLSPLNGHTLVQYAGSLTGRDFRAIAQIGPSVLYDLLPDGLYAMWVSMSRLGPLIYQPTILNIDDYLITLEGAICDFLKTTALWNIAWFNKPKFHLLLHLPRHVRYFGPAMFFATEGFESHNAIIRKRSVHSNGHAPSTDIATAFSYMHAIRFLVSGGYFQDPESSTWVQAGSGVLNLVKSPIFEKMVGLSGVRQAVAILTKSSDTVTEYIGKIHKQSMVFFSETSSFALAPTVESEGQKTVWKCSSLPLENGDNIKCGSFIMYRNQTQTFVIGQALEILAHSANGAVSSVLVKIFAIGPQVLPYSVPVLKDTREHILIRPVDILGLIHTYHNCAAHGCTVSRTRAVRQERVVVSNDGEEILHKESGDILLNLSIHRHASLLQQWQPSFPYANLSVDEAARQGVQLERDRAAETEATRVTRAAAKALKGKGRREWQAVVIALGNVATEKRLNVCYVKELSVILSHCGNKGVKAAKKKAPLIAQVMKEPLAMSWFEAQLILYQEELDKTNFDVHSGSDESHSDRGEAEGVDMGSEEDEEANMNVDTTT